MPPNPNPSKSPLSPDATVPEVIDRGKLGDQIREWWFPHRSFEFGGRLYEWTGIRAFYVFMAQLAGEPVLPKLGEGETHLSPGAVAEWRTNARYHEWANIVLYWTYIPGLVGGLIIPNYALFWISFVLSLINVACVLAERYKRAVCTDLLARGATGIEELPRPKAPEKPLADWYFVPKRWESVKLYETYGGERFRQMMVDATTACRFPPHLRKGNAQFIASMGRDEILGFEATTRTAEMIHTGGFVLHLVFFIAFWRLEPAIAVYLFLLLLFDFYFMVLQRYHRNRVWKLVERFRTRRPRREPAETNAGSVG